MTSINTSKKTKTDKTASTAKDRNFIDDKNFQQWLEIALDAADNPQAGIYGPGSMMWKVGRESISFLGAGRAVLLQLAHPWIANAIDQHSQTRNDPLGRGRRTFINVFSMIFGNTRQVRAVAENVHRIHGYIKGSVAENSGAFAKDSYYQANAIDAMLWVHATLWDTQLRMYELVFPPLSLQEKEQYYQETKLFAHLFGIPESAIPLDWAAFQEYMERMYNSPEITVRSKGREMGDMIFNFGGPLKPALKWLQLMTAFMLTPRLRTEFGLPEATIDNLRRYERGLKLVKMVYPRLPDRLRYLPSYNEAIGRLDGKQHADLLTQGLNYAILGQRELVSNSV